MLPLQFSAVFIPETLLRIKQCMCVEAVFHLGVCHVHDVLVSLDALHDVKAIAVQHFGLCIA